MRERLLFLTGHLAFPRLMRILDSLGEVPFDWEVVNIGVKVAALMTGPIILHRLPRPIAADRIIVPGRCRADLAQLSTALGVPVTRGPDELADLPAFLGSGLVPKDLSRFTVRIFAEIVDASALTVEALVARAARMRSAGADVIDLGCLPDTPFPRLEDAIRALKGEGHGVSVDSADPSELSRGAKAGADFLLSLDETNLGIAEGSGAVPILVPRPHGDLDSLVRAADEARRRGLFFIVDPRPDPFRFRGLARALCRDAAQAP